jgi:hypothetical protein
LAARAAWLPGARAAKAALCCALVCAPRVAHAQSRDPAAAEGLFQAGKAAMEAGQVEQACALFRQSRDADGAPGTTFHLADCEEKRGRLATAWALFGEAALRLPAGDTRIALVRERAAALAPRLPQLAIDLDGAAPPGTTLKRDDVDLGAASGTFLPVDPGKHTVVVSAPGHAARSYEVTLVERERRRLPVSAGPALPPAITTAPAPAPAPQDGNASRGLHTTGFVVAGLGVATVVAGVAVALSAQADYDDSAPFCRDDRCSAEGLTIRDDARTLGTVATAMTVVGAVGAGAGAVLWLATAPGPSVPGTSARAVSVRASWRGVRVAGSF